MVLARRTQSLECELPKHQAERFKASLTDAPEFQAVAFLPQFVRWRRNKGIARIPAISGFKPVDENGRADEIRAPPPPCGTGGSARLENPAVNLILLDGFEERPEVPLAKPVVALSLDEFEEDRPDHGL